jgi:hypothetical protein
MELLASMSFSRRLMGGRVKVHRRWWGWGWGCESFFWGPSEAWRPGGWPDGFFVFWFFLLTRYQFIDFMFSLKYLAMGFEGEVWWGRLVK